MAKPYGRMKILRPCGNWVRLDSSVGDLTRNHVPEPDRQDSVVDGDDAHANGKRARRLAEPGIFPLPVSGAENYHQNGEQSGNRGDEAYFIGQALSLRKAQKLPGRA